MADAAEFLEVNNDPMLFQLRRSGQNLNKIPVKYNPMLLFRTKT